MTEGQAEEKSETEAETLQKAFMEQLDVDEEVASILVQEGFSSVEEIAYLPTKEMLEIEEFNEDIVEELRARARDVLLTRAIASEESEAEPAEDLLALDGMEPELAQALASRGVRNKEELAEQSVDELVELVGIEQQLAGELIMAARASWFESEQEG